MIRIAAAALCAITLIACAPDQTAERCDLTSEHEARFTGAEAPDIVEARTFGPNCGAAVAVMSVRSGEGHAIYAWAAPLHPTFGPNFAPRGEGGPQLEEVQGFLDRWSNARIGQTSGAPAWSETLDTHLDEPTYNDLRTRNAPMLCFLSAVAEETCLYWESAAAAAAVLYRTPAVERAAD
ncbi:MAG: hypothetical protein AB7J28_16605 [Hyphomonadaceae bacterium]